MKKIIIISSVILLLTGCYNYHEVNDLAIVSAMGIEKVADQLEVTIEIINTQKAVEESTNSNDKTSIIHTQGKTLAEAINNLAKNASRHLFFDHMDLIIIGPRLAEDGIKPIIDYILRQDTIRNNISIVASQDRPYDVINTSGSETALVSKKIVSLLANDTDGSGLNINVPFDTFINELLAKNKTVPLSSIKLISQANDKETDNSSSNTIILDKIAVFQNFKLVSTLKKEQALIYKMLVYKITAGIFQVTCLDTGKLSAINVTNSKTKYNINANGDITINLDVTSSLTDYNCRADLKNPQNLIKIENTFQQEIKKEIKDLQNTINTTQIDLLNISTRYYNRYPHNISKNKLSKEWTNFNVVINPHLSINKKGRLFTYVKGNE